MRPRDRQSSKGLLPRMEARPRKDGLIAYRYHPMGGKPVGLGTDKHEAIRKVLDLLGVAHDRGTVAKLWQQYKDSIYWKRLKPRTHDDYTAYSVPLLKVFGEMRADAITAPHVARYLRLERAEAPVRANREIALLGNLIGLAIERGEAQTNPCRGGLVKRNPESPSDLLPEANSIQALIEFAKARDAAVKTGIGRSTVVMLAAEFAALTGARQIELLALHWPAFTEAEVRLERGKQRLGVRKVDRIAVSPALADLRKRLLAYQMSPMGAVFPTEDGNAYTSSGFATMWQRLIVAAVEAGIVSQDDRFNFHALRAYYATQHKTQTGALPDMHADPGTTAKVYERSKVARRKAL